MLRDKLAAIITPILVLLNGGFGWVLLWDQVTKNSKDGLVGILQGLPPSFTVIPETTWRWGNAMSTLLIPQRGLPARFATGSNCVYAVVAVRRKKGKGRRGKGKEGEEGKRKKRKKLKNRFIGMNQSR